MRRRQAAPRVRPHGVITNDIGVLQLGKVIAHDV
jgi:hypothetical protein